MEKLDYENIENLIRQYILTRKGNLLGMQNIESKLADKNIILTQEKDGVSWRIV